jgi:hypothetical protein
MIDMVEKSILRSTYQLHINQELEMLSIELMNDYITALKNFGESDKAELIEIVNLLKEFKTIQLEVSKIQRKVIELIKSGTISKYIEIDGQLYCLETGNIYHPILVNQTNLTELIKLKTEINDNQNKLNDYIASSDKWIEELCIKEHTLIEHLATEAKSQAAIDTDKLILVNKENNFYQIVPQ